ncbi:MAG TPA: sodium:calcium antiporter [Candidatus Paceibacterota bacterium]|nr:sodium:calcium antiporter [Candidatus Paceibacterota bacterium]HMP19236.1 sodium:calcium antiporter [Candidatus Paceibacterota bacterium]HMP85392.1 sodium:calcium antiporter [Candidatus Paceibacterota bacterium]
MLLAINILIFIFCCFLLYIAGELIVKNLLKLARYLGVTEFVVAFFVMAVAASLPNLFVGITSALKGVSELSFGDIMGNNMIAMTLAVGLAVFFSPSKEIPADCKTIQKTSIFTIISAVLPIILISDGIISRIDGIVLLGLFAYYIFWLFSKKERFSKIYDEEYEEKSFVEEAKLALSDILKIFGGGAILLISAQGIVFSASSIARILEFPLVLVGLLILGFGSALPEIYFGISSAKKGETQMILGNLMGAVIIPASLVIGIVSIISPIKSEGLEFSIINRIFLILAAIFFFLFTKSHDKVTKKESYFLVALYILFVTTIIITKIN